MTYRAAPSGRSQAIISTSLSVTRHRLYVHGEDERVVNPGDLLVESRLGGGSDVTAVLITYFRGSEIAALARTAAACAEQYEANKDWLSQPVTA